MLLKRSELERIRSGQVRLVFRRWRKATVKTGGTLRTALGVLAIERIDKIDRQRIKRFEAEQAGYASLAELLALLDAREGDFYRIAVRWAGDDPRLALREHDDLSAAEMEEIRQRLARLDAASAIGAWTLRVLQSLRRHPHEPAAVLAQRTGWEKERLKTNVRKLKNLGLSISHHPGYELSPRGHAVLKQLERDG